jgi:hypothetical protein
VRFDEVTRLLAAFEQHGVRYVLIGSMAMAAHGLVRATQDIDFFIDPGPENVAHLRSALHSVFEDESINEITSEDLAGPYPVLRYGPPQGGGVIDFVGRLGEAYTFDDIDAVTVVVDGVTVRVASPRMLFDMKRGTVRPQDRADAEALRTRFDLEE